jgi:dTDP-4-amino-4,6-dideoxygalactose transaminase
MCAKLLNLGPKDEVILPSFTFVSTANALTQSGARPIFADINLDDMNIDVDSAEKMITPRTKAICIVHYGGAGASPFEFQELCDAYDLTLIEDNAHGLGGKFKGKLLGTFGQLASLSFHETKNIVCGEGGATIINDLEYLARAKVLRDKGTNRDLYLNGLVDKYTWVDDGSSWVLSEILAAFLYGQLENLNKINEDRNRIWNKYKSEIKTWAEKNNVQIPNYPEHVEHTSHLFYLRFDSITVRNNFISYMSENGIQTPFHYQALHQSPFATRFLPIDCPKSSVASETIVRLPIYYSMEQQVQNYIIEKVISFKNFRN